MDPRPFDLPWIVMDAGLAKSRWGWKPAVGLGEILTEIADHADQNPGMASGMRRRLVTLLIAWCYRNKVDIIPKSANIVDSLRR